VGDIGFNTFKEYVQFRMGRLAQGTADGLTTAGSSDLNMYGIWVNQAYRQICTNEHLSGLPRRVYIPALETSTTATTTDGTAYVSVPSDCLLIRSVYDTTNNVKLAQIPWRVYISYTDRATTSAEGDATEWCRSGARIYLHPTPQTTGDTMTIYYKKLVATLSGTDTTAIPAEWDEPIVQLATIKGHMWTGDFDKIKPLREEFVESVSGILDIYAQEAVDRDANFAPDSSYLPLR